MTQSRSLIIDILKSLLSGFIILVLGIVVLYYGNYFNETLSKMTYEKGSGRDMFCAVLSMFIHCAQVSILTISWILISHKLGGIFYSASHFISVMLPPLGIAATWHILPLLSSKLVYSFPMNFIILILVIILFQLLLIDVDNMLDRGVALLLWFFSFHSLELLPNFSINNKSAEKIFMSQYESSGSFTAMSMAGTALFFSFMAGAVASTWLLANYSIRLGQMRMSWKKNPSQQYEDDESLKIVSMVDMRTLVHDLKNPLSAIKGTAMMLQAENGGEKTAIMIRAVNYMEHMIREMLHEEERTPVSVAALFNNIEQHLRPFPWGSDVTLNLEPEADKLYLSINEIRLTRAILNIMDNAWRANRIVEANGIEVNASSKNNFFEIEVTDNGPGHQSNNINQSKSGWGSTGLGLAFARRVINLHNGSLLLSQRLDGKSGTTVLITLPLCSPPV